MPTRTIVARAQEALAFARRLKAEGKNWLEVHNALYGLGGKCAVLFPTRADRTAFAKTSESKEIAELLNSLPDPPRGGTVPPLERASGNLHVRLPRSLHAALRVEAEAENISLNQLIVAKLSLQLRTLTGAECVPPWATGQDDSKAYRPIRISTPTPTPYRKGASGPTISGAGSRRTPGGAGQRIRGCRGVR